VDADEQLEAKLEEARDAIYGILVRTSARPATV
jgi:hypothetical protein